MPFVVVARQLEPVDTVQQASVPAACGLVPRREDRVELLQLPDPDRRANVVEAVVEAESRVLQPTPAVGSTLAAQALEQAPRRLGVCRRQRRPHPS